MYKVFIGLFIFCLILFLYLHIHFHVKTSNDLEVFELDMASKDKLDEICDLRQPVLLDFEKPEILEKLRLPSLLQTYHAFEIKVRNTKDPDVQSDLYMPIPLHAAKKLFQEDKCGLYISERNSDFLQETGVKKHMQYNDEFIRPPMVSSCNYDLLFGSECATTPFRYELNYRNFFAVTEGKITMKLSPPQNSKYLYPNRDYEQFEFRSPVDPWNVQPNYKADFDKMKCLEVILTPGKMIYVPAYWWYTIRFEKNSSVACFRYRTYINTIAIVPHIAMHALQLQNIKRDVVKKHGDTQEKEKEEDGKEDEKQGGRIEIST